MWNLQKSNHNVITKRLVNHTTERAGMAEINTAGDKFLNKYIKYSEPFYLLYTFAIKNKFFLNSFRGEFRYLTFLSILKNQCQSDFVCTEMLLNPLYRNKSAKKTE